MKQDRSFFPLSCKVGDGMVTLPCEIMKDPTHILLCHLQGVASISVIQHTSYLYLNYNRTEGAKKGRLCLFPLSQNLSTFSLLTFWVR